LGGNNGAACGQAAQAQQPSEIMTKIESAKNSGHYLPEAGPRILLKTRRIRKGYLPHRLFIYLPFDASSTQTGDLIGGSIGSKHDFATGSSPG
jgi:hypothetical protein